MFGLQMTQKRNDAMINKLLFKNVVTQNTDVSIVPECSTFNVKLIFKDLKPSIFKYFSSLASPLNKTDFSSLASPLNKTDTVLFTGLARLEKYLNTFLFTGLARREKYLNTFLFIGLARREKYLNTYLFTGLARREKQWNMEGFKSLKINFTLKSAGESFETLKSA